MCLTEKTHQADDLHSDTNYSAVGPKFYVIKSKVPPEKGRENVPICTEALQKVLQVMSAVHEEATGKMEMWVTLWILFFF